MSDVEETKGRFWVCTAVWDWGGGSCLFCKAGSTLVALGWLRMAKKGYEFEHSVFGGSRYNDVGVFHWRGWVALAVWCVSLLYEHSPECCPSKIATLKLCLGFSLGDLGASSAVIYVTMKVGHRSVLRSPKEE